MEKRKVEDKLRKIEKDLNETKRREGELKDQLSSISSNIISKIQSGRKLDSNDISSP